MRSASKKAARKKADIAFHNKGIEDVLPEERVRCDCGHFEQKNKVCKHHIKKKKTKALRYDHSKAIRVCWDCHTEIESIGDVRWARQHQGQIEPWVYERLVTLKSTPHTPPDVITPTTLSDIL